MLVDMIAEAERRRYPPDILALFRRFHMRALHLQVPARAGHAGMPGCWYGGRPTQPPEIDWPVYVHRGHALPMHFIAQFDCASLPRLEEYPMPETGVLMFFFDGVMSYDRAFTGDYAKGGRVIYVEDVTGIPPREAPPMPDIDASELAFKWISDELEAGELSDISEEIVETWNAMRGKPPLFEEKMTVEAVVIGEIRSCSTEEERAAVRRMGERYHNHWKKTWEMRDDALDDFFNYNVPYRSKMMGSAPSVNLGKRLQHVPLLLQQFKDSLKPHFTTAFVIHETDLLRKDFSKSFVTEPF